MNDMNGQPLTIRIEQEKKCSNALGTIISFLLYWAKENAKILPPQSLFQLCFILVQLGHGRDW